MRGRLSLFSHERQALAHSDGVNDAGLGIVVLVESYQDDCQDCQSGDIKACVIALLGLSQQSRGAEERLGKLAGLWIIWSESDLESLASANNERSGQHTQAQKRMAFTSSGEQNSNS